MLWISFCQRRGPLGGQGINAGAAIDAITVHVSVMPCSLAHGRNAGHDTRRDFRRNTQFAARVEDAHQIAVFNSTLPGIKRIDPHLLAAGGL